MKNQFQYIALLLIALFISQYTIAGTGAYITLVNGTPYKWRAVEHSTFQMEAWNFPKTLNSGESRRIYLEYIADDNRSAMVKYEIAKNHIITIEFDGGYSDHTVLVSSNFLINDFDTTQIHWKNTIHDGMVSFILVGSVEDGFYTNFASHSKNWMHNSLKLIGNKKLEKICIPGSHDAGMYMLSHSTNWSTDCNTLTQDHGIFKQLEYGIRYFDIRPVIAGSNEFYAGHYGYIKKDNLGWQGGAGGKIADFVKDINEFTKHHKELIILDLSHDFNTNDKYRHFNKNEWNNLFDLLSGINHLYIATTTKRLKDLCLNDFIKNEAQVIILVDPAKLPTSSKYYRKGFYHTHEFSIYNEYSNTDHIKKMREDQIQKMHEFSSSRYFLLSWTLTQTGSEPFDCMIDLAKSIKDMAKVAKQYLPEYLYNNSSITHYPNIIYTDLITDNTAAIMSMAINYRNLIDANYTKVKKIATDHIFYVNNMDIKSIKDEKQGLKEMFFNYDKECILLKSEPSKSRIALYYKFDYKHHNLEEFSSIKTDGKGNNVSIMYTTKYDNHLVVGWLDNSLLEIEKIDPNVFPFKISTLDISSQNAKWTTKAYHSNQGMSIIGAYTIINNNSKKLCFVYNDRIKEYDFNPKNAEINNLNEVFFNTDYKNKNIKITQVLPYENKGETNLLIIGKQDFLPGFQNYFVYQYYPHLNQFHKAYEFYVKQNVVFVESNISKIYKMPENQKSQYIKKRFQAFVLDYKKVPTTNFHISYIYTFGIAPDDSLLTYLSTYAPTPPSFSFFPTDYNLHKPIYASRNYKISKTDTLEQTWFWYPLGGEYFDNNLDENSLFAMVFDDNGDYKSARLTTRKTVGTINWKIYPNPIAGNKYITVEYETKRSSDIEIKLYSIQGALISSKSIKNNDIGKYIYQFDTENLSKGTYYITIRVNNDFESKLLLVQ